VYNLQHKPLQLLLVVDILLTNESLLSSIKDINLTKMNVDLWFISGAWMLFLFFMFGNIRNGISSLDMTIERIERTLREYLEEIKWMNNKQNVNINMNEYKDFIN
jgi:response regulator of citrate/malate metabolism